MASSQIVETPLFTLQKTLLFFNLGTYSRLYIVPQFLSTLQQHVYNPWIPIESSIPSLTLHYISSTHCDIEHLYICTFGWLDLNKLSFESEFRRQAIQAKVDFGLAKMSTISWLHSTRNCLWIIKLHLLRLIKLICLYTKLYIQSFISQLCNQIHREGI